MIANDFGQLQGYELQGQSEADRRAQQAAQNYFTQQQFDESLAAHHDATAQQQAQFIASLRQQQLQNDLADKRENYFESATNEGQKMDKAKFEFQKEQTGSAVDNGGASEAQALSAVAQQKRATDDSFQAAQDALKAIADTASLRANFDPRKGVFTPKTGNAKANYFGADPRDVYMASQANDQYMKAKAEADLIAANKKQHDADYHATLAHARALGFDVDNPSEPSHVVHVKTGKVFPLTFPDSQTNYFDNNKLVGEKDDSNPEVTASEEAATAQANADDANYLAPAPAPVPAAAPLPQAAAAPASKFQAGQKVRQSGIVYVFDGAKWNPTQ